MSICASAGLPVHTQDFGIKYKSHLKDCNANSSPPQIPVQPIPFAYDLPNLAQAIEAAGNVKCVALVSSKVQAL
jgi:hypothetical protein